MVRILGYILKTEIFNAPTLLSLYFSNPDGAISFVSQLNLSQMYLICMFLFLERSIEQGAFDINYIHPISWLLSIIWGEDTEWSIFVISTMKFQFYCIHFYPFQSFRRRVRKQANQNVGMFWSSCYGSWIISYKQQTITVYINSFTRLYKFKKKSGKTIFLIVKFLVLLQRKPLMCLWVKI